MIEATQDFRNLPLDFYALLNKLKLDVRNALSRKETGTITFHIHEGKTTRYSRNLSEYLPSSSRL